MTRPRWLSALPYPRWLLAVAGASLALHLFGAFNNWARRGLGAGRPAAAPVYGRIDPALHPAGIAAVVLVAVAAVGARALWRRDRVRPWAAVTLAGVFLLAFAASVAATEGTADVYVEPIHDGRSPDYHLDLGLVRDRGIRGFVRDHPSIVGEAASIHTINHPPGPLVLLAVLEGWFPSHVVPRALILATLSAAVVVPAWAIARRVAGERAALLAVMLLAVAPAPVLHAFLSLDAVLATAMVACIAALLWGVASERLGPAALAGAATGLLTFMTYAAVFVAAFGVLYALGTMPRAGAVRRLGAAAVGGVAALAVLRIGLGFDLFASYAASRDAAASIPSLRPYAYWIVGNSLVWLTFAGLPIAALSLRSLVRERPPHLIAMAAPLALFYVLPWSVTGIIPGETERTLQFAYPTAAAAAAAAATRRRPPTDGTVVGVLVGLTAAQTVALEILFRLFW